MITLGSVKNRITFLPCPCIMPKNESLRPENGKKAIGATIPILMPTLPATTSCWNCLSHFPLLSKNRSGITVGVAMDTSDLMVQERRLFSIFWLGFTSRPPAPLNFKEGILLLLSSLRDLVSVSDVPSRSQAYFLN